MKHQLYCTILIALTTLTNVSAQTPQTPLALSAIREQDIKNDIFEMAGDHFRGREAGTLDELKVAARLVEKVRAIGLRPGGDDGSYFQYLARNHISPSSTFTIGTHTFTLCTDV